MVKRVHLFISGKVQGVYYRAYTREVAERLGIKGWVRNLPDGRVEVVAEGDESALKNLIAWCWEGPPLAKVEYVEEIWEEPTGEFNDFRIRRD